jgi:hypothetical protein
MSVKRLPAEKTIVTELSVVLADQFIRNRLITDSVATKVPFEVGVKTGDATTGLLTPLVLSDIKQMVYINAWGPIQLKITDSTNAVINVSCTGTFLLYGALLSVEVKPAIDEQLRLSYVYA